MTIGWMYPCICGVSSGWPERFRLGVDIDIKRECIYCGAPMRQVPERRPARKTGAATASGYSTIHPLRVAAMFEDTEATRAARWRRIEQLWVPIDYPPD